MINFLVLLSVSVVVSDDTLKPPGKDAWQLYMVADFGAYSKFELKELDRDIPINKAAHPLMATATTGYFAVRKDRKSLSLGTCGLCTEASGLFRSSHLDTEQIDFSDLRAVGEYRLWSNKQVIITPRIGCVFTWWTRYRVPSSGKHERKDGADQVGVLGGVNLRLQKATTRSRVIPFVDGTYDYCTPFDGVNRCLLRMGLTWVVSVFGGRIESKNASEGLARVDVGLFRGYTWGPFVEARDHGIDFKLWFLPTPGIWNYEWW